MEDIEVKRLTAKRGTFSSQLTFFNKFLSKVTAKSNLDEADIEELGARLNRINQVYDQFDGIQNQLESIDSDIHMSYREEFEETYFSLQGKAKSIISNFNRNTPSQDNNTNITREHSHVKLPTISLPSFDGNFTLWSQFIDTFTAVIDSNDALSNVQKLCYLRASLKGEALNVIHSLETTNHNYHIALSLIKERYDYKRKIIFSHVQELLNATKRTSLLQFINGVENNVNCLESLGIEVEKWDAILIPLITSKLDKHLVRAWESNVSSSLTKDKIPSFKNLIKFLLQKAETFETPSQNTTYRSKSVKQTSFLTTDVTTCLKCQGKHYIYYCPAFLALTVQDRIQFIKKQKLCMNCLRKNHSSFECRSPAKCKECNRPHNTLLHIKNVENQFHKVSHSEKTVSSNRQSSSNNQTSDTEINVPASASTHCSFKIGTSTQTLLSTAQVIVFDTHGNQHTAKVLLDSASQSNYITERLASKLKLPIHNTNIMVSGINQNLSHIKHCMLVDVKSVYSNFQLNLSCLILSKISDNLPYVSFNVSVLKIPQNISLADEKFNETSEIDMLIGSASFWKIINDGRITLGRNMPTLQNSKFGWIVGGQMPMTNTQNQMATCLSLDSLEQTLKQIWEIDHFPDDCKNFTVNEQRCEALFKQTVQRTKEGRFIVTIPLKENHLQLGDSKGFAIQRFYTLEKRFNRNQALKEDYQAFINEYFKLGHMTKISSVNEYKPNKKFEFFLPHHAVIRELSTTTKLRVVFNGSAKSDNGVSLNDIQLTGPTIQTDLVSILLRFRTHQYAVSADIEKMYRQILIAEHQRPLQQIVWRDNPSKQLEIYQLNTVTYGTTSAPYLAIRCLFEAADVFSTKFPKESDIIRTDFYVDDFISGAENVDELSEICNNIYHILSSAGFVLRKWHSNISLSLSNNDESRTMVTQFSLDDTKTLGLNWDPKTDSLQFQLNAYHIHPKITKRCIVSSAAQLFDPLGLLTPVTIIPKILIQKLWTLKLGWDDTIPEHYANQWKTFQKELLSLKDFRINRYVLLPNANYELHGFADASESAYGACVYLISKKYGEITTQLLTSKSRVAPLKQITLPRLELCAAVLLASVVKKVKTSIKFNLKNIFLYSDSTITLAWIKTENANWKTFVANRVSKIQTLTQTSDWYHVCSKDNPADIISRGVIPSKLKSNSLWWHGPSWIGKSIPVNNKIPLVLEIPEKRVNTSTLLGTSNQNKMFEKFSNLNTLIKIIAYCQRFIHNCKSPANKRIDRLTCSERKTALNCLIELCQAESFPSEIARLKSKQSLSKKSKILQLNPFLDVNGILRVGGRLEQANIPYNQRHQIILPSSHSLTSLIAEWEHKINLHCGPQMLLYAMRQNYWPLSGKNLTKRIVHKCITCWKQNPKPLHQLMGNLPSSRVTLTYPFATCGIDYAGPFLTIEKRARGVKSHKAYICLFICFASKGIHLELVSDLTSKAFINALRRFVARRGIPKTIVSDNATNFVGANSDIKKMSKLLLINQNEIDSSLSNAGINIEWKFIPPRSPHFGGLWESHIKLVKRNLSKIIGLSKFTFEEFATILTQIEAIINSRPLSPINSDPSDLSPLTPSHFLIGRTYTAVPDEDVTNHKESSLSHYQRLQHITQHFWKRWQREYISNLQQRTKWTDLQDDVLINSLVLLVEDNLPPSHWRLGRIVELHPGKDNKTRVVSVKTQSGILKRAITKICILPTDIQ